MPVELQAQVAVPSDASHVTEDDAQNQGHGNHPEELCGPVEPLKEGFTW